ncbi:MAG: signal peptide peptidase SppA [Phycisphaerae bacterium]|nr:signal peptide peptidase SppA [Phycisphaerae bacterium]
MPPTRLYPLGPATHSIGLAFCGLFVAGLLLGCAPPSFLITPVPARQKLVEHVVERESVWATRKIALIDVDGVLTNARSSSLFGAVGENPVAVFTEKLDQAAADRHVRAVVIRINSPGGGVTASDLMYTELCRFRARSGKPVIAALLDIATSGGYYLACAADEIYAHPTTVTGSIGVIMLAPEFSGTMRKLGIQVNAIKSGDLKDAGSPFHEMSAEERAVFQGLIDQMYTRFFKVVARARGGIEPERLRKLADGRVYLGCEARENGLVDEIGTPRDAIRAAKRAAGLADKPIKVVQYSRPYLHRPNVYARTDQPPGQVNLVNIALPDWLDHPAPRFMYLWAPGW